MELVIYVFLSLSVGLLILSQDIRSIIFIEIGIFLNIALIIFLQEKYFLLPMFLLVFSVLTGAVYIFSANAFHFNNSFKNRRIGIVLIPFAILLLIAGFCLLTFYPSGVHVKEGLLLPDNFFFNNKKMIVGLIFALFFLFQAYIVSIFQGRND